MEEKPYERKKLLAIGIIVAVAIAATVGAIALITAMMSGGGTQKTTLPQTDATSSLFYDSLGNAAKQQQLRVAMYRSTYASKPDADANQNIGTQSSSVAELDTAAGKMRSVWTNNIVDTPQYAMGRCLDGTTYSDDYNARNLPRPTTLDEAEKVLRTSERLFKVTQALVFIPCPNLGLIPGAIADFAAFRFSDGLIPVTLNETQASNWKKKVVEANLFTIKDEGMVDRNGKQLKKISFTSKDSEATNQTLYSIFNETAEIDKIKAEKPDALYQYEFISIGPANSGGIGGYYLIDEATKLPVYSELYGTNKDRDFKEKTARLNIAKAKQTYEFGKPLSLTYESQLEILK